MLAQQDRSGGGTGNTLLATEGADSVLSTGSNPYVSVGYSPYGHRESAGLLPGLPGFNGEQPDPLTGHYLLGNGYRAFNPVLMRFNSPDSLSPFTADSLNSYAYCVGDPVNRIDPGGHLSLQNAANIGLGVLGTMVNLTSIGAGTRLVFAGFVAGLMSGAVSIAQAATEENYPQAGETLGWVAMGLGAASLGFGLVSRTQKIGINLHRQSVALTSFTARKEIGLNVHRRTDVAHLSGGAPRMGRMQDHGSRKAFDYPTNRANAHYPGDTQPSFISSNVVPSIPRAQIGVPGFSNAVWTRHRELQARRVPMSSQRDVRSS